MLLTIPQAASQLSISRQRVWLLVSTGRIKAQQVGQQWLIKQGDLSRYRPNDGGRPRKARPAFSSEQDERETVKIVTA